MDKQEKSRARELRKKAEQKIKAHPVDLAEVLSFEESQRVIQELHIHQIELEMQNEELRLAQIQLEESRARYVDLYDFAPVGYLTFNERGQILDVNLTAATQLGLERVRLIKRPFVSYVVVTDKDIFRYHLSKVFESEARQTCEVRIKSNKDSEIHALIESVFFYDALGNPICRSSLTDISERKKAEERLQKAHDEMEGKVRKRTVDLGATNQQLEQEIIKRTFSEQALKESEAELRILSHKILTAQEQERERIALELHDGIGQSLTAIKFFLETAYGKLLQQNTRASDLASFPSIISMLQQAMEELASISVELRPSSLDDLGLVNTLRWFGGEFQNIYPHIHLDHAITIQEDEVPENLKIVIFRVVQEGLNNVAKHSDAGSVRLSLDKKDGAIELDIHDTGTGFDPNSRHVRIDSSKGLGLGSMRERTELSGGSFTIESIPGKGTIIRAVWPERVLH